MSIQNVKKENVHGEHKKPLFMHEKNTDFFSTNWKKYQTKKKKILSQCLISMENLNSLNLKFFCDAKWI